MIRRLDEKRNSIKADSLKRKFADNIVGQSEATVALTYLLNKHQSGFYDKSKPLASLLFLGPTGTGKTAVAEEFVNSVFCNQDWLLKVDCGEFQHSHDIARLIGSPPGYLGHRETHPYFTNERLKERRNLYFPFTVILWDEIEKASDALWNLMLGVLDKGRLTTGTNELIDFKDTVHIMTSNVGSQQLSDDSVIGFTLDGKGGLAHEEMKEIALGAARRKFMPEFLGRIDKIVMFKAPTPEEIRQILAVQLDRLRLRISERSSTPFVLEVSPRAIEQLVSEGFNRRENARFLKKTIEQRVEMPLVNVVSTGQVFTNDTITVDYVEGEWRYIATTSSIASGFSKGQMEVPKSPLLQ
jgi:ATP-dependent Clp protease ATP-binding subunit ClpB